MTAARQSRRHPEGFSTTNLKIVRKIQVDARYQIKVCFYFSPSTRVHVVPFTGGLLLLLKATGAAREPNPRPFTTVGEPIPRTGRHWELNPVPLDLQTNALPTELTGRVWWQISAIRILRSRRKPNLNVSHVTHVSWVLDLLSSMSEARIAMSSKV